MTKKAFFNTFLWIGFISCLYLYADKATPPILDEDILKRIQHEVSGSICFEHIRFLSTLNREFGFKDHHLAAQYLVDKAADYGLKDAVIERYPQKVENDESYWKYIAPYEHFWNCRGGALRLVKPYPMLISDFESATGTVAPGSRATDLTAEVVFVGRGDSENAYQGKDVRGKIVLSENGIHMRVHELAVHKFGALGTIHYPNYNGRYPEEREAITPLHIWPWTDKTKEPTFGFNLSETKGLKLKEMIEKGEKVIVACKIDAEVIRDGAFELATAVIPGSALPQEEFIFFAHLDHSKPGAHDNASGCAVLLEIARTLSRLIQENVIPAPSRTIRFMWIPHMSGLEMYFFHHPEKIGKIKGGCNADCVGVNQAKYPSNFHVSLPPYSQATYLTDIANNLIGYFNETMMRANLYYGPDEDMFFSPEGSRNLFYVHRTPYLGSSDEYAANIAPWNIPSLYFQDSTLPPRHSQLNFLDYMDSTNLGRISYLGAIISYAFAALDENMAPKLLDEINYQGKNRLERELNLAFNALESSGPETVHQAYAKGKNLLHQGIKRELRIAQSLEEIISKKSYPRSLFALHQRSWEDNLAYYENKLAGHYRLKCRDLNLPFQAELFSRSESPEDRSVPILNPTMTRLPSFFRNNAYFGDKLGDSFIEKYKPLTITQLYSSKGIIETFNYIDGRNTIAAIHEAVEAELWSEGYSASHMLSIEELRGYLRLLQDAGVIDIKKK